MLAVNLIIDYGNGGQLAAARALLDRLEQLAAAHPDEPEVRVELAQGAFNLIVGHAKAQRLDDGRAAAHMAGDALMSAEFAVSCREQFGEEVAAQVLAWLRSLLEP